MHAAPDLFEHTGWAGWLALAGAPPSLGAGFSRLAEILLEHTDLSRPPLALIMSSQPSSALQAFLDDLEILLGVPVECLPYSPEAVEVFDRGGLILLAEGEAQAWLEALQELDLSSRLPAGGLVVAIGGVCGSLGEWICIDDALRPGLGWISHSIVVPGESAPGDVEPVLARLSSGEKLYAVGLGPEAILALGPSGEVEVWSDLPPTIALGTGWLQE